jgi:hypothetical protein
VTRCQQHRYYRWNATTGAYVHTDGRGVEIKPEDELREKFIVTRYAKEIRRGRSPKQAREIVAEEIREGRHLPPMRQVEIDYRPAAYGATYSEKSVARVLRKYSAAK